MTLTIKRIQNVLRVNPCTKFRDHTSSSSAVRALTEAHAHKRLRFITSTSGAGGNYMPAFYTAHLNCPNGKREINVTIRLTLQQSIATPLLAPLLIP